MTAKDIVSLMIQGFSPSCDRNDWIVNAVWKWIELNYSKASFNVEMKDNKIIFTPQGDFVKIN